MGVLITLNERIVWPLKAEWAGQPVEVTKLPATGARGSLPIMDHHK